MLIDPDGRQININVGRNNEYTAEDFADYVHIDNLEAKDGKFVWTGNSEDYKKLDPNEKQIVDQVQGENTIVHDGKNYKLIVNAVVVRDDYIEGPHGESLGSVPGDSYKGIVFNEDGTAVATQYFSLKVIDDMRIANAINSNKAVAQHGLNEAITGAVDKCPDYDCAHGTTVKKYGFGYGYGYGYDKDLGACKKIKGSDNNRSLIAIYNNQGKITEKEIHRFTITQGGGH